jgi:hypothetical protein
MGIASTWFPKDTEYRVNRACSIKYNTDKGCFTDRQKIGWIMELLGFFVVILTPEKK